MQTRQLPGSPEGELTKEGCLSLVGGETGDVLKALQEETATWLIAFFFFYFDMRKVRLFEMWDMC